MVKSSCLGLLLTSTLLTFSALGPYEYISRTLEHSVKDSLKEFYIFVYFLLKEFMINISWYDYRTYQQKLEISIYVRYEYENIHICITLLFAWAFYKSRRSLKELKTNLTTIYG